MRSRYKTRSHTPGHFFAIIHQSCPCLVCCFIDQTRNVSFCWPDVKKIVFLVDFLEVDHLMNELTLNEENQARTI